MVQNAWKAAGYQDCAVPHCKVPRWHELQKEQLKGCDTIIQTELQKKPVPSGQRQARGIRSQMGRVQGCPTGKAPSGHLTFSKTQCSSVSGRVRVKHKRRSSPWPWLCHRLVRNVKKWRAWQEVWPLGNWGSSRGLLKSLEGHSIQKGSRHRQGQERAAGERRS